MISNGFKKLAIAACLSSGLGFTPAKAGELDGSQIKSMISGQRVLLATSWGFEFPLVYRSGGSVTGDGTGTRLAEFFAPKETGKWWIRGNQMCQQFPTWYKGRTFCFSIQPINSNKFIWKRDDGRSGTARLG